MVLSAAISEERLEATKDHPLDASFVSSLVFGSRWAAEDIPRVQLPDKEMPASVAYKLIHDELALVN